MSNAAPHTPSPPAPNTITPLERAMTRAAMRWVRDRRAAGELARSVAAAATIGGHSALGVLAASMLAISIRRKAGMLSLSTAHGLAVAGAMARVWAAEVAS